MLLKVGVWLLVTQKPKGGKPGAKETLLFFRRLAAELRGWWADSRPKADSFPPVSGLELLQTERAGYVQKDHSQL